MNNQVKSLIAELKTVIYKHAEAEHTIIKLRAQIGEQQKHINTLTNEKLTLQARVGDLEEKAYWKEISDIQADEYRNELENKVKKLTAELKTEITYHAGGDTHYRAVRMRAALKREGV